MLSQFDRQFNILSKRIKRESDKLAKRLDAYFLRLLLPIYLFPIKLITYSTYYLIMFVIKSIILIIKTLFKAIIYPFKSLSNFLKSVFIVLSVLYVLASLVVIADYLRNQYGWYGKFFCAAGTRDKMQNSVVRVVGGYSEGSGFFINPSKIITNFHVIADEPSPKIILPDGKFITPKKILGDQEVDLAVLVIEEKFPDLVFTFPDELTFKEDERLLAIGYPLGTELSGKATVLKGNFVDFRQSVRYPVSYIQTNISLIEGMSGGPLTDQCGQLVGVNTMSLSGLSLFITAVDVKDSMLNFTDQEIIKIEVDPSISPAEAVKAFYTYLKARRMQDGFDLLSKQYLKKTDFEEWTSRFTDILDVQIFKSESYEESNDTVFVKFSTKNWVRGEAEVHFYEGTWETVLEDGVYKMNKSKIKEVDTPGWDWFYE